MTKLDGHIKTYTDGGARGNPGPAGIGFVVEVGGEVIEQFGQSIGSATNNVAEYKALIAVLSWIVKHESRGVTQIDCYLDSRLVVQQLKGEWKIKNENLRELYATAKSLEVKLNIPIAYHHIPREQNAAADALVNQALDEPLPFNL